MARAKRSGEIAAFTQDDGGLFGSLFDQPPAAVPAFAEAATVAVIESQREIFEPEPFPPIQEVKTVPVPEPARKREPKPAPAVEDRPVPSDWGVHQVPTGARYFCVDPGKLAALQKVSAICNTWAITMRKPIVIVAAPWADCQNHRGGIATFTAEVVDCIPLVPAIAKEWGWTMDQHMKFYEWKLANLKKLSPTFTVPTSWGFYEYDVKTGLIGP